MKIDELILAADAGDRLDIVMGELVRKDNGFLLASKSLGQNVVYVDKIQRTYALITPKTEYRGRNYKLKQSDCVRLVLEWLARERNITSKVDGTNLLEFYARLDNRLFVDAYKRGAIAISKDFGFNEVEVSNINVGDVIGIHNHIGVVVSEGMMLHHLPQKLSSIDPINFASITQVFRYAN